MNQSGVQEKRVFFGKRKYCNVRHIAPENAGSYRECMLENLLARYIKYLKASMSNMLQDDKKFYFIGLATIKDNFIF